MHNPQTLIDTNLAQSVLILVAMAVLAASYYAEFLLLARKIGTVWRYRYCYRSQPCAGLRRDG